MQLGFNVVNQIGGLLHFFGLDGPSCVALEVVSSIDVLPCGSGIGSHLFGLGVSFGCWQRRDSCMGGCSSVGGALVG